MRGIFTRVVAGGALALALVATPAVASAAPMPANHGQAGPTYQQQTAVHATGGAWGVWKPDPNEYPRRYTTTFYGPDSVDECLAYGAGYAIAAGWDAYYCWTTFNHEATNLYYRL